VTFHSTDRQGNSVYHTNVMMAIGTDVAVVCLESVDDPQERKHLRERLSVHHQVPPHPTPPHPTPKGFQSLCISLLTACPTNTSDSHI